MRPRRDRSTASPCRPEEARPRHRSRPLRRLSCLRHRLQGVEQWRTHARFYGDLGDPASAVSEIVAERGGRDLMPELGYRPVNKYLPPRRGRMAAAASTSLPIPLAPPEAGDNLLLQWVDRLLSR